MEWCMVYKSIKEMWGWEWDGKDDTESKKRCLGDKGPELDNLWQVRTIEKASTPNIITHGKTAVFPWRACQMTVAVWRACQNMARHGAPPYMEGMSIYRTHAPYTEPMSIYGSAPMTWTWTVTICGTHVHVWIRLPYIDSALYGGTPMNEK